MKLNSLLLARSNLGLGNTTDLLGSVFPFLLLLSAGLSLCLNDTLSDQSVLWFKLFSIIHGIIDKSKTSAFSASEVCLESKGENSVGGAVVKLGQLLPDVGLADTRFAWMQNVNHHLTSAQETVQHVLACANGDTSVNHGDFSCRSESS